jgi:hypothetical protein
MRTIPLSYARRLPHNLIDPVPAKIRYATSAAALIGLVASFAAICLIGTIGGEGYYLTTKILAAVNGVAFLGCGVICVRRPHEGIESVGLCAAAWGFLMNAFPLAIMYVLNNLRWCC